MQLRILVPHVGGEAPDQVSSSDTPEIDKLIGCNCLLQGWDASLHHAVFVTSQENGVSTCVFVFPSRVFDVLAKNEHSNVNEAPRTNIA